MHRAATNTSALPCAIICLLLLIALLSFCRKSSQCISAQSMTRRSRCWCGNLYQDWRNCCQFQTSHRCHDSLNFYLAESGIPAQIHPFAELVEGVGVWGKRLKKSHLSKTECNNFTLVDMHDLPSFFFFFYPCLLCFNQMQEQNSAKK